MDLCELLTKEGVIRPSKANHIREAARRSGTPLVIEVLRQGVIKDKGLLDLLARRVFLPVADLASMVVDPEVLRLVPQETAERHLVLPVDFRGAGPKRKLRAAMVDPFDKACFDELERISGHPVMTLLAEAGLLIETIRTRYGSLSEEVVLDEDDLDETTDLLHNISRPVEGLRPVEGSTQVEGSTPLGVQSGFIDETSVGPDAMVEADLSVKVEALVNLLRARGVIAYEEYLEEIRRLLIEERS